MSRFTYKVFHHVASVSLNGDINLLDDVDFVLQRPSLSVYHVLFASLCACRFAGYDTGACKQPAPVVYTLKLLIGAAPVAFIVTGLLILLLYPINEDVRLRNKVHLEELRCVEIINGHLRGKV